MHDTLANVGRANDSVAVTIARWHGASSKLTWISCGTPRPMHIDAAGALEVLGSESPPLGTPEAHTFAVEQIRVLPGERIVLASDGVTRRRTGDGTPLGLEGIRRAAASVAPSSAAGTVKAIEDAVRHASSEPLEDDATLIVLAPVDTPAPSPGGCRGPGPGRPDETTRKAGQRPMLTIILIVLLLLLLFGGFGYSRRGRRM